MPILTGIHPSKLLSAKTMTETGEFPKLSGNSKVNLLLLMNRASKSLSKSCLGSSPSNSLNLKSRNFKLGNWTTTSGKFPTNRLLLRSNSKRSFKFKKLSGIVPQNLLEFIWINAMSNSKPNSCGSLPAISPWLISIPETVSSEGWSSEGEQKTPV